MGRRMVSMSLPARALLRILMSALLVAAFFNSPAGADQVSTSYGWLENVAIYPPGMKLSAKLDTGADSCSVHAEKLDLFEKGGDTWVRFTLANRFGDSARVSREVVRNTKIKKKAGGAQKRPVVRFGICIGEVYEVVECNLVNRSHFQYPVLVGRNFLAGTALVDSSSTFTVDPGCKDVRPPK